MRGLFCVLKRGTLSHTFVWKLRIAVNVSTPVVEALTKESILVVQQKRNGSASSRWVERVFKKAEASEPVGLTSVDAIFSETLKRLCVSEFVSKRFDQSDACRG
jgi:hypothetical protein